MIPLVQPPNRRSAVRVVIAAVLVGAICWYFGADLWHSILLASAITTLLLLGLAGAAFEVGDTGWRSDRRTKRGGSRSDIAELSWSLRGGNWGRVAPAVVWRVSGIARQRLAPYHLDLSDPSDRSAIEQLIGRRAYGVVAPSNRRPPLLRSVLHCLDVLDSLDASRPPRRTAAWSRG